MASKRYTHFEKKTINFLQELGANNNREWFKANKARYEEDVLDVALHFILTMQDPLAEFAPHFTAVPTRIGGSLMRVYRDTRFSNNKLPYKTNIGIQLRHDRASGNGPSMRRHSNVNSAWVVSRYNVLHEVLTRNTLALMTSSVKVLSLCAAWRWKTARRRSSSAALRNRSSRPRRTWSFCVPRSA